MVKSTLIAGGIAFAGLIGSAGAADDPVFGFWLTENKRAIIEISPCGETACGKIVWMQEPLDADGHPKIDTKNQDPALQGRPICGLPLIGDFRQSGPGAWNDGFIYSPQDGDTYTAKIEAQSDGNLKLRGYLGLPIFGKSQIWTREADGRGGC